MKLTFLLRCDLPVEGAAGVQEQGYRRVCHWHPGKLSHGTEVLMQEMLTPVSE